MNLLAVRHGLTAFPSLRLSLCISETGLVIPALKGCGADSTREPQPGTWHFQMLTAVVFPRAASRPCTPLPGSAVVGLFTPWKLADALNQSCSVSVFVFSESWLLNIYPTPLGRECQ